MSSRLTTHAPITQTPRQMPGLLLQRKCAGCGNHSGGGQCNGCAKKEDQKLQRRAAGIETATEIPPIVDEVLNSPGQPLDTATRVYMEPRFRHDFSRVRVHADAKAAESARAVDAHAYTAGSHIVFDTGRYAPGTTAGKNLLAHELTHVLQQSHGLTRSATFAIGPANDEHERQADAVANAIASTPGRPAMHNVLPLIPGTQQQIVSDAPPLRRLQRRSREDQSEEPDDSKAEQPSEDVANTCPKTPTKRGKDIPNPACPTATHTGAKQLSVFNFCLDSDQLTNNEQLNRVRTMVGEQHRSTRFLIHGYASPEGGREYNLRLACHRANAIADEFREALRERFELEQLTTKGESPKPPPGVPPELFKAMLKSVREDRSKAAIVDAEVESRIETAAQGGTTEFGKGEANRVVVVYAQTPTESDPEPSCANAPRHIGDIQPEIGCDVPKRNLLTMNGSQQLSHFHFCLDSDVLKPTVVASIRSFAHSQAADANFIVHGFSSVEGAPDYNQRLSCHRALRIFRELINAGVPAEQITEVSGLGETDHFGHDPEFNRIAIVFAEGGDVSLPEGKRAGQTLSEKQKVRDEAVERIMSGQYKLGADAYIRFWTCGRTATVRDVVERLRIDVKDPADKSEPNPNKTERVPVEANGLEELGFNHVELSNATLRADNAIECTMGRIIDMAFHHAVIMSNLPAEEGEAPNRNDLPDDLINDAEVRHAAGLHLIHLAGLSSCTGEEAGRRFEKRGDKMEPVGIDEPLRDDPRQGQVPDCAPAAQPTRLHQPVEGAKNREVPAFEIVGQPTYLPADGGVKNSGAASEKPGGGTSRRLITTPDKGIITACAMVQLKGNPETFQDYEIGFIQAVIFDEGRATYHNGAVVEQRLPVPIRLAEMRGNPRVPPPWTANDAMVTPDDRGIAAVVSNTSGLNSEIAATLDQFDKRLSEGGITIFERSTRIAIWLVARRRGAPLDRFSVHFLDGVMYGLHEEGHTEHHAFESDFDEMDRTKLQVQRWVGRFGSSTPSLLPEDPSSARFTGPIASEIGLFNQVHNVVKFRDATEGDMTQKELTEEVRKILDNLVVFEDEAALRRGAPGTRKPRLGYDFIPLMITMPFVRKTGQLGRGASNLIVTKVRGPGLGEHAANLIALALERHLRDRVRTHGRPLILKPSEIPLKHPGDEAGEVIVVLEPLPKKTSGDKGEPDLSKRDDFKRNMAQAWDCTKLTGPPKNFTGKEFGRAFWMDRERGLHADPENTFTRGTVTKDGIVTEGELPCVVGRDRVVLGSFHTHPDEIISPPEPSPKDLTYVKDCSGPPKDPDEKGPSFPKEREPQHYIVTGNQAFRFFADGTVIDEPIDLPVVPCPLVNP